MYDLRLDEALDSMPLAPLPEGFSRQVMAKIERPQVRFRLTFLDLALPAFFTLFTTIIVGAAVWIYTTLDPLWMPRFILYLQLTWLEMRAFPHLSLVGFGFVGRAIAHGFAQTTDFRIYDINKTISENTFKETIEDSDYIFICVPTPMKIDNGDFDLSILDKTIKKCIPYATKTKKILIAALMMF